MKMDHQNAVEQQLFLDLKDYEIVVKQSHLLLLHYHIPTRTLTVPEHVAALFGIQCVNHNAPNSLITSGLVVDNKEEYQNFFESICAGSPEETARAKLRLSSGKEAWFEAISTTVFDSQDQPLYAVITISDVSAIREKELAFEKWKATNRSQKADSLHYYDYDLTTDLLEAIDGSLPSIYPNQNEKTFSGVAAYVAEHIIHPDDRKDYLYYFSRDFLLSKFAQNELEIKTIHRRLQEDGSYMWAQGIIQLFQDPYNGNVHCIVMIKRVEESFSLLREELREDVQNLMNNSIPGGIIAAYDQAGYPIYYINDHMLNYLGYTRDEFMAVSNGLSSNLIHPDDLADALAVYSQATTSNTEFELRYRILKKDGSIGWVIEHGRKSTDKNGQNILISVYIDITEIVTLQEELQQAALASAEATKMKSLFLANMSHEIRTPMNGILGFIELAQDEENLPVSTRNFLEKIKLSTTGLLSIINDILDISKIEAGKMELEHITFNLHDVFKHCETISRVKAEEKGVALYFYSEPFVWQKLLGDPTKLSQILLNLLSNAIKFTEKGSVKLEAILESSYEQSISIRFIVKDSGIGMTEEELERVFAPFSQADNSTTRKYGGTGLGLTITRDMIALMGGELKVESAPGEGSIFSFTLSFETTNEAAIPAEKPSASVQKPRFSGEVLVCEDNQINQQVICEHLGRIGLTSIIAANGQIGVDLVSERIASGKPFDLIMMDIHMPIMDGIEATHKLLALGITTPIIALTANAMKRDRESYLALGMSDYISKPFYAQELWNCLLRHLKPVALSSAPAVAEKPPEASTGFIDSSLGLKRAANDEVLYLHLKKNFVTENQNKYMDLCETVAAGDLINARRIAHSLKSNAGWIGATELAKISRDIEMTLADGIPCTSLHLEQLKQALNQVLSELVPLMDTENTASENPVIFNPELAGQLIENLEPLLQTGNADCINLLDEINEIFAVWEPYRDTLIYQINNYDFNDALKTLKILKEQFKNRQL